MRDRVPRRGGSGGPGEPGGAGAGLTATVVGGGLAGCEAAWALAQRGVRVRLVEMRPVRNTPAHQTDRLAELVCSNTFKSTEITTAHGLGLLPPLEDAPRDKARKKVLLAERALSAMRDFAAEIAA